MDSSFTPIEQMLKFRSRHEDFPYQEILLTRLCMHMQKRSCWRTAINAEGSGN